MPEYVATSPDGKEKFRVDLPADYDMSQLPAGVTLQPMAGYVGGLPPKPETGEMTSGESFMAGVEDPYVGWEQTRKHAALAPDAASYDAWVRARDENLRGRGVGEASRTAGNLLSPPNLMLDAVGGAAAPFLPRAGRAVLGGLEGAAGGMTQPVTGDDFATEKAAQTAIGTAVGAGGGALSGSLARERAPAVEDVAAERTRLYRQLEQSRARINRGVVVNLADLAQRDLRSHVLTPIQAPRTFDILDRFRTLDWLRTPLDHPTVLEFDQGVQALKDLQRSPDAQERRAASFALDFIDAWLDRLPRGAMLSGNPGADVALLRQAQNLHRLDRRADALRRVMQQGDLQAAVAGYGGNIENAGRQQVRRLLNSREARYMTQQERDVLESIARGSYLQNTLRHLGKFAPAGPVSILPALLTAVASGDIKTGVGVGVVAYALKTLADRYPNRALRAEADRILASSGLPPRDATLAMRLFGAGVQGVSPSAAGLSAEMIDALAPHDDALQPSGGP